MAKFAKDKEDKEAKEAKALKDSDGMMRTSINENESFESESKEKLTNGITEEERQKLLREIEAVESTNFHPPYIILFAIVLIVLLITTLF